MIIGICGLAGAGKDTFADGIIAVNPTWKKLKMATILKDITAQLFGWNREWLDGETLESREWREQVDEFWNDKVYESLRPFTPRKALQFLGTEVGRNQICGELWSISLCRFIQQHPEENYIITDVRFLDELKMINSLGGVIVEIQRDLPSWYYHIYDYRLGISKDVEKYNEAIKSHHSSETSWIGNEYIKYVIYNDGKIEHLYNKANKFVTNFEADEVNCFISSLNPQYVQFNIIEE